MRVSTSPVRWLIVPRPELPYQYLPGFCLASATNPAQSLASSALVIVTTRIGVDSRATPTSASGSNGTLRATGAIDSTEVGATIRV